MIIRKKNYINLMHMIGSLSEQVALLKEQTANLLKEVDYVEKKLKETPTLNLDLLKEDMEEDAHADCNNCIHGTVSPFKEPCSLCFLNPFNNGNGVDEFYPTAEGVCRTCKHFELVCGEYPCSKCVDGDKWEK